MIQSLRSRVVLSLAGVTLLILGIFVAVVFLLFRDRLRSDLDENLRTYATEVAAALRDASTIPTPRIEAGPLGAVVLASDGRVIESTSSFEGELETDPTEEDAEEGEESGDEGGDEVGESSAVTMLVTSATAEGTFLNVSGEHGTELRAFSQRVDLADGVAVVATLAPASASGSPVDRLLVISLIALVSAVLVVVAIAYWVGGLALRPFRSLATEVRALGENSLEERVGVPDRAEEVADVATAVNALLSRIELSIQRERAFIADASHELRNPLAALRAELELSARNADPVQMRTGIEGAIEETDRLANLAGDLLLLARADAGNLKLEAVSLADVASTAILHHARNAESAKISLKLAGPDVMALGSFELAERAVANLIENALRHAPSESTVDVVLWSDQELTGIDVSDEGPGIPKADRQRIFDRFSRVSSDRARAGGGTGLGLAIVTSVMQAMGGSVLLVSADPGNTVFRLTFASRSTATERTIG